MSIRELKLFGDTLYFDDTPIASIAHVPAGMKMLLDEHLHAANAVIEDAEGERKINISKLIENSHKMVFDTGTDNYLGQYFEGPPLPDDCVIVTVVPLEKVKDLLTDDEGFEIDET